MKRFYENVSVEEAEGGFRVSLDDRPVKTQRGAAQVVPTRALADALAEEWRAQGETIDPASLRLRDQADYAIDIAASDREALIEKLLGFAGTDTLCYRADPEDALYRRQQEVWEPLVTALEAREGIRLERVSGIVHRKQPAESLAHLRTALSCYDDFTLAALEAMTSLAASLCIGLAALEENTDAEVLWHAAELEEGWQAELWGNDAEAEARRATRYGDFLTAVEFFRLSQHRPA